MVHQIILALFHALRRAKVHAIRLARVLDLLVRARQADEVWVELLEVFFQDAGGVARGIACYHEGCQDGPAFRDHFVVHEGHFVEFVRADVRAVGEAEIYLISHDQTLNLHNPFHSMNVEGVWG
jgi:hypothetical protein